MLEHFGVFVFVHCCFKCPGKGAEIAQWSKALAHNPKFSPPQHLHEARLIVAHTSDLNVSIATGDRRI